MLPSSICIHDMSMNVILQLHHIPALYRSRSHYSACSKVLLPLRKHLMALKHPMFQVRFISAADKAGGGVRKSGRGCEKRCEKTQYICVLPR